MQQVEGQVDRGKTENISYTQLSDKQVLQCDQCLEYSERFLSNYFSIA